MKSRESCLIALFVLLAGTPVYAHCDTLDGPVVTDARLALDRGDVNLVLKWVPKSDEAIITEAFRLAVAARKQGAEAGQVADRYFFETVVRMHRQSEGAPYSGLKSAGTRIDPAILAADTALEKKSLNEAEALLIGAVRAGLHARFDEVLQARKHMNENVEAGRDYVAAYVSFMHYLEQLHQRATESPGHEHSHHE